MSEEEKSVSLNKSSTSSVQKIEDSSDEDKPNITVDAQKEVHLKMSDKGDSEEGSIIAAPDKDYPVDSNKDPKISHVPEQKAPEQQNQSKCCLLLEMILFYFFFFFLLVLE